MRTPVGQCGKGVSEDQEEGHAEVFWTNGQRRPDCCTLRRCVSSRKTRWNSIAVVTQMAVCGV